RQTAAGTACSDLRLASFDRLNPTCRLGTRASPTSPPGSSCDVSTTPRTDVSNTHGLFDRTEDARRAARQKAPVQNSARGYKAPRRDGELGSGMEPLNPVDVGRSCLVGAAATKTVEIGLVHAGDAAGGRSVGLEGMFGGQEVDHGADEIV